MQLAEILLADGLRRLAGGGKSDKYSVRHRQVMLHFADESGGRNEPQMRARDEGREVKLTRCTRFSTGVLHDQLPVFFCESLISKKRLSKTISVRLSALKFLNVFARPMTRNWGNCDVLKGVGRQIRRMLYRPIEGKGG